MLESYNGSELENICRLCGLKICLTVVHHKRGKQNKHHILSIGNAKGWPWQQIKVGSMVLMGWLVAEWVMSRVSPLGLIMNSWSSSGTVFPPFKDDWFNLQVWAIGGHMGWRTNPLMKPYILFNPWRTEWFLTWVGRSSFRDFRATPSMLSTRQWIVTTIRVQPACWDSRLTNRKIQSCNVTTWQEIQFDRFKHTNMWNMWLSQSFDSLDSC